MIRLVVVCFGLLVAGYAALALSPWPSALLIRLAFSRDAASRNELLSKQAPPGIRERIDIAYGTDPSEKLDLFLPPAPPAAGKPVIVWVHGGGFVGGAKEDVAPYLRILAGRGYAVVGVGYRLAPAARYPEPARQVNEALGFLREQGAALGIDPCRIVLAGDSAGAHIAAQLATALIAPDYAATLALKPAISPAMLRGTALFCGIYDVTALDLTGFFGGFVRSILWSYFGTQDVTGDRRIAEAAVARYLTEAFPPSFVSAGNGDPLASQSVMMADAIRARGVAVETLFFPPDYAPAQPHEYQFGLGTPEGRQALERLTVFLNGLAP